MMYAVEVSQLRLFGPFETADKAADWADYNLDLSIHWAIVPLNPPPSSVKLTKLFKP